MVRSLWTAATGMIAQQTNLDVISNNLANVNTVGYKTSVAQFKTLLYQEIQAKTTTANAQPKPIPAQVGLGVRPSSVTTLFRQGIAQETSNPMGFMIQGNGFFAVQAADGNTYYTRNGDFNLSLDGTGIMLCDSQGSPVLDTAGAPIKFPADTIASEVVVDRFGEIFYPDANGTLQSINKKIGIYQFSNPAGLSREGDSYYAVTEASGAALNEASATGITKSKLVQGYLEGSNVQVVDEMVGMIVTQRAYELNSKAITASDEMMSQANQLRR